MKKTWDDFYNALMKDERINKMYAEAMLLRGCKECLGYICGDYLALQQALPDSSPDDEIDYQDFGETLRNYCE